MQKMVHQGRLIKLLRISETTLRDWRKLGLLTGRMQGIEYWYEWRSVDAFLAHVASGFKLPPTLDDLIKQNIVLLTSREALEYLAPDIGRAKLLAMARKGAIAGLKFPKVWRFSQQALEARLGGCPPSRIIPYDKAIHILGSSTRDLHVLVKQGKLRPMSPWSDRRKRCFARSQLLEVVRERLPPWIDPQYWIDHRLGSTLPTLTLREVWIELGTHVYEALRLVKNRQLLYITVGSEKRFSPESVRKLAFAQPALSGLEVGRVFGVTAYTISTWRNKNILACPLHNHDAGLLFRRACVVGMLRQHLSPGLRAGNWFLSYITGAHELVEASAAAAQLGAPQAEIVAAAEANLLSGLKRPDGTWVFTKRQIKTVGRKALCELTGQSH